MKKLSNFHRKVLNIVVTLMAAIALMLGNVTSVAAYTADTPLTGYPFPFSSIVMGISDNNGNWRYFNSNSSDQNTYYFDSNYNGYVSSLNFAAAGSEGFVIPVNLDIYDYYLVGTVAFTNTAYSDFHGLCSGSFYGDDGTNNHYVRFDVNSVPFYNDSVNGESFYCKLDLFENCNVNSITFTMDQNSYLWGDVWFSASIMPVLKSGTEADTLNSILQTLTQINQNIITGNTLQQQTIDAINQNTTNTSNWFTTLITTMQSWYNTQTENLRTWFYMIEERMSAGFTALYHQMTKEQDEKLNGYDDTTQSDAAENFSSESDKLTEIEGELSDQSHQYVSDFTTTGFDVGVLSTISESLIFVTTWFTNFWNLGGIFTACLNLCFALSIVFYVLRFRK